MFRLVNTAVRTNLFRQSNTLSKVCGNSFTIFDVRLNSTESATEKARAESIADLKKVLKVIGRLDEHVAMVGPEFNDAWVKQQVEFYNRPNIDGWEIRRGIHVLADVDAIPEPVIIDAVLRACRRLNDISLAIRFLEFARGKCGNGVKEYWPYIMKEIQPTLDELGIPSLEEIGYDRPELAVVDVDDIY